MCIGDDCRDEEGTGRRTFLGGAAAALVGLTATHAPAGADARQQPSPPAKQPETRVLDDPRVEHGPVRFRHGDRETIDGYLARPKAEGRYPAVVVIAGNVITEEYIPNTCAALAVAGFVGLAPNIFHTLPESARTPEERRKALAGHTHYDALEDIQAGINHLRSLPDARAGGHGVVGFCYGGRLAMLLGALSREIDAVVPYHPGPVKPEEVARLKAPVQVHCGTADRHIPVAQIRDLEKTLRAQRTPVEVHLYEGADHGFLAYTRPYYRPADAALSWRRAVEFLKRHLS